MSVLCSLRVLLFKIRVRASGLIANRVAAPRSLAPPNLRDATADQKTGGEIAGAFLPHGGKTGGVGDLDGGYHPGRGFGWGRWNRREKAQEARRGKSATKGIEPRISRISRIMILHLAFRISVIRVIRAIRGKILMGDSLIAWRHEQKPAARTLNHYLQISFLKWSERRDSNPRH